MKHILALVVVLLLGLSAKSSAEASSSRQVDNPSPPAACDRGADSAPLSQWFSSLMHSLCRTGDADSLLSAYLISFPFFEAGDPDYSLLRRAYAVGKSNPGVLWVVATDENCQFFADCRENLRAVDAAKALTGADRSNAMAWLVLAYAEDRFFTKPDEVSIALNTAAKAPRIHDYTFDLMKLVVKATGRVPIPDAARNNGYGTFAAAESIRWPSVLATSMLSASLADWLKNDCQREGGGLRRPERHAACSAAKAQLQHGDSQLTLSENPDATAALQADVQSVFSKPDDVRSMALISAILHSNTEREMYAKAAAQLSGN